MKKTVVVTAAAVWLIASMTAAFAVTQLSNIDFAAFLQRQLGIEMPAENSSLPREQFYQSLANALAAEGVNDFMNTSPDATVSFGRVVDIIYRITGHKDEQTSAQKAAVLMNEGYLTGMRELDSIMTLAEVQEIFTNPGLTALIAETYVNPPATAVREPGQNAPGVIVEQPASLIK